jgi:ubiquinone/menaquinone biosynthesis C-methylase UbiE
MSVIREITARYTDIEAWIYDSVVAPAVASLRTSLVDEIAGSTPRGARIADVGCGGGQIARRMLDLRPDLKLVGVDLSRAQVRRAVRACAHVGQHASFVQGSALALPLADRVFDAAISVASIKHWPDQRLGLTEMTRILRGSGRLWLIEADRGCSLIDARNFVARWRLPAPLRPLALAVFRTWVAGQSLDLDELRDLAGALDLQSCEVRRLPGAPALVLAGRR